MLRNKVRLRVIPLLQELNPAVTENILRTSENLTEAQGILDSIVSLYKNSKSLDLNELNKYGSSEYILFEWLKAYGFNGVQVKEAMGAETGSIFTSSLGYDLLVDRGRFVVEPTLKSLKPLCIPEEGTYVLDEETKISVKKVPVWVSREERVATLDASKVHFPLTVRRVEKGDKMVPYGMRGHRLLSDIMTDRKMTLFEKRRQIVVVDAKGIIVWLAGIRISDLCQIDDTTTEVVEIHYN